MHTHCCQHSLELIQGNHFRNLCQGVSEIISASAVNAVIRVRKHILPDFGNTDGYRVSMGEAIQGRYLIAHCVGRGGGGDIDCTPGIVGSQHDLGGCGFRVSKDVCLPVGGDARNGLFGVFLALIRGMYRPPGLHRLAQRVQHGAFFLIVRQVFQHGRLQHGIIRDNAAMGYGLLDPFIIDHRVAG